VGRVSDRLGQWATTRYVNDFVRIATARERVAREVLHIPTAQELAQRQATRDEASWWAALHYQVCLTTPPTTCATVTFAARLPPHLVFRSNLAASF
jgi:hypothetical protein